MNNMKRRKFIKSGAAALTTFMIVPRHVLGGKGYISPSSKLNIAGIGIGGKGSGDLRNVESENIVALCDVDERYAARIFNRYPDAKNFKDYREMLDSVKEIDAVMIATPDHTHAVITMAALKAGKHVFCQKPLTHNIEETLQVMKMAKKTGLTTQMGIQGHAMEGIRLVCEWIWDGAIGDVYKVDAWCSITHYPPGHAYYSTPCDARPHVTPSVPGYLDWDLWLGPASFRPYSPCYHPLIWRNWWDFGSSMMADRGAHTFDPIAEPLKLKDPISIEAICTDYNTETFPVAAIVNYRFPEREKFPPLELTWYEGLRPPRPKELDDDRQLADSEGGALFTGTKGKLMCGIYGGSPRIIPESKMRAYTQPAKSLPRSEGIYKEWLSACKNNKQSSANFEYSGVITKIVQLGNLAKRFNGKVLHWDAENQKVTNTPEANQYLNRVYREGWSL